MSLNFKYCGDDVEVRLAGEIDEFAARSLRDELDALIAKKNFRTMTLDMQGVSFVDSTGLGLLLGRYKKLRASRAELLLKNIPPQVDKVFKTSGVYSFIPKKN